MTALSISAKNIAPPSTASPTKKWLHQNPLALKAAILALGILGLKRATTGLKTYSVYHIIEGLTVFAIACFLNKIAPIIIPPTYNPAIKAFKSDFCRGVTLDYQGNLPLLTIPKEVSSRDAGFARGYLMASSIRDLLEKNNFAFFTLKGLPRNIPFLIEDMKKVIPADYLIEMQELVEGYNQKRSQWIYLKGNELTLETLIYFHLLPDIGSMDFVAANNWAQRTQENVMGCSVVVDGNEATGTSACRTVDWVPMDVYGKYSFVEQRETKEGMRSVGQSFPLFIGTLTSMNEHGLCLAMNVARGITDYPIHMPAVFYLRKLTESCTSVDDVEQFCLTHKPLGSFNLNALDCCNAKSIHFYQGKDNTPFVRNWNTKEPLITLNYRYGEEGRTNPNPPPSNSEQRQYEIESYYKKLRENGSFERTSVSSRLKEILKGPEVNNIRTVSTTYFYPKERKMEISFDNGYAADRPLLPVPTESWFSRRS